MNERENRRYMMLGRVETFGRSNSADFGANSRAAECFANISRIIQDLDKAKAAQKASGITAKEVLVNALRLDLQNILRTAQAIAQDEPGFADHFAEPSGGSLTALLTSVDAIIREIEKPGVADKMIAYELPAELIQELKDDRNAIAAAQDAKETRKAIAVASTAGVGSLIEAGIREVTHLNAIMHNKYARNPERLRAWRSACMIERSPRRAKSEPAGDAPETPPATV